MSLLFGEYRQSGYVVESLDRALKHWTDLGAGPFFVSNDLGVEGFIYRGIPTNPRLNVAVGNFGSVQIELIEQFNDEPSPYRDFLSTRGPGLHHFAVFSANYDADLQRWAKLGLVPDVQGTVTGVCRFCYLGGTDFDGTAVEVVDVADGALPAIFEAVHAASVGWDGRDPVRTAAHTS
jgi:hypothetical protein